MYNGYLSFGAVVAFLAAAVLSPSACSEPPYIGGECAVNDDCQSEYQNVPGTGCVNGSCQCLDPSHKICCARGETPPDCFLSCRPCEECAVGTEGCPSGCQSDAECPGPSDVRCGIGRCIAGECTVEIHPGALPSQLRGDCQRVECAFTGEAITLQDPSDFYDDGEQCTTDICGPNGPQHEPLFDGTICPNSGTGRCLAGTCVDCYVGDPSMISCPGNLVCDYIQCVPLHCVNSSFEPALGETAEDCGGACQPCNIGEACTSDQDCETASCQGVCKPPTCEDGVNNDAETGVDCGAPSSCPLCGPGQGCDTGADCSSGVCWAGVCEPPSCFDGVRNDDEAGIDCGATCGVSCP